MIIDVADELALARSQDGCMTVSIEATPRVDAV